MKEKGEKPPIDKPKGNILKNINILYANFKKCKRFEGFLI